MKKKETFAARLTHLRERAGITVYRLAKDADVDPSFITRLEKGKTSPSLDTAIKLARALGVSVAAFE